jgi:hypothetical protein
LKFHAVDSVGVNGWAMVARSAKKAAKIYTNLLVINQGGSEDDANEMENHLLKLFWSALWCIAERAS